MSLALLFHYLMLNMFRMLIHPSSGAWALNNEIIKQVTSSWSLFIQLSPEDWHWSLRGVSFYRCAYGSCFSPISIVYLRSRYDHGTLKVRWRYDHSTLMVRSQYAYSTITVRSRYAHSTLTVRSQYTHATLTVRLQYAHGTRTVLSQYTHATLTVRWRYDHSTLTYDDATLMVLSWYAYGTIM